MDALSRERPISSCSPTTQDSQEDPAPAPFSRRLLVAIVIQAIAVAAHVWLVRAPDGARPVMPGSSAPALALSQAPQSRPAPRSTLTDAPSTSVRRDAALSADAPAIVATAGAAESRRLSVAASTDTAAQRDRRNRESVSPIADARPTPVATNGARAPSFEPVAIQSADSARQSDLPPADVATLPIPPAGVRRADASATVDERGVALPVMSSAAPELTDLVVGMAGPWAGPGLDAPRVTGAAPASTPREAVLTYAASDLRKQEARVLLVLEQLANAYERMDVQAAKAVWPTLDARALSRAFHRLDSQQLRFTDCGVSISGQAANAHCHGDATYHPRVGSRPMHVPREWTFRLARHEDGWQIVTLR